jgi:hypothetical protein
MRPLRVERRRVPRAVAVPAPAGAWAGERGSPS